MVHTPALQIKPHKWSCSVTAFAMALRVPVAELIEKIGHDGSQIIFPALEDPMCRRGFHSQELIRVAWQYGFACTPIELFPRIESTCGNYNCRLGQNESKCWEAFTDDIMMTFGVLEGQGRHCHHAVQYRHGVIWDPDDGDSYFYSRKACEDRSFFGNRLWIFTRHNI